MNLLYSLTLTVTNPIDGDLKPGLEEGDITPGLLGFLATLFLALAVVFLIRDMVKRIRRVRYRAQVMGEGTEDEGREGVSPAGGKAPEGVNISAAGTAEDPASRTQPGPPSSNPAG
ncbi:MAG: hypothetical protein ABTA24_01065 [Arthrobacter sp.]